MLDARNVGRLWPRSGGDQDILGSVAAAGDLDSMRVDQSRVAVDDLDTAVLQHTDVDLAETADLLVLRFDQRWPVEARRHDGPTEAGGVSEGIGELRPINEQLLRHAAA